MSSQITVHRDDIVKQGWLIKKSKFLGEWRRRWFVLTPQYLCSFKAEGELRNPTEAIRLRECHCVKTADDCGKENALRVDAPNRVFYLIADTSEDKEQWIGKIGQLMIRRTVMVDERTEFD
mmetsp:Transcript_34646/g.99878  ORF Transcript_34646/g.99878 Transcript_34646/m.99878 type:complete len:121 (-) Transcript_34646:144-506(-)